MALEGRRMRCVRFSRRLS